MPETYYERNEREKKEHRAWCRGYERKLQDRLDTLNARRGLQLRAVMTSACSYYVVNDRTKRIITGNGLTGRTPSVLNKMLTMLEGALS